MPYCSMAIRSTCRTCARVRAGGGVHYGLSGREWGEVYDLGFLIWRFVGRSNGRPRLPWLIRVWSIRYKPQHYPTTRGSGRNFSSRASNRIIRGHGCQPSGLAADEFTKPTLAVSDRTICPFTNTSARPAISSSSGFPRADEQPVCPSCGKSQLSKKFSIPAAHTGGFAGKYPVAKRALAIRVTAAAKAATCRV